MPTHSSRDLSRLNLSELRGLTGAGERTIRRRLEGLAPVAQDGRTVWYPAREALARVFLGEEMNLSRERARLAREQADAQAMKNAVERGELERVEVMETWLVQVLSAVVQHLDALPAKVAPEAFGAKSIAELEGVFKRYLHEARRELADALVSPPKLGRPSRARGNGAPPAEAK